MLKFDSLFTQLGCAIPAVRSALGIDVDSVRKCRSRAQPETYEPIEHEALDHNRTASTATGVADGEPELVDGLLDEYGDTVRRGDQQVIDKDIEAAIGTYYEAAAIDPRGGLAYRRLGEVFLQRREPAAAVRWLRRATELEPHDTEGWHLLGISYRSNRNYHEAEKAFTRALAIAPTFNQALIDRATVRIELEDKRGALADAHAACENGSMDACEIKWQVVDGLTDQELERSRPAAVIKKTPPDTSAASPAR